MGVSSAMTPKDRRDIQAGLIAQGAVYVRDGKRGSFFNLPNGARFQLPFGTSDHKARDAMRAEVRRNGLHWPLDGEEPRKKETTMSTDTLERPLLDTHQRIPATVVTNAGIKPREALYRQIEPLLKRFADKVFWTDEFANEARALGLSGYSANGSAGSGTRAQQMLDFAGFRVIESKRNRNGYAYRWRRDERMPWPTEFAATLTGAALARQKARLAGEQAPYPGIQEILARREAEASVALDKGDGQTFSVGTDEVEPEPEQAEVATITEKPESSSEDEALEIAVEQERRAEKAERALEVAKREIAQVRKDGEDRARSLLRRIAEFEGQVLNKNQLLARAISERDEARALAAEAGPIRVEAHSPEQQAEIDRLHAEIEMLREQSRGRDIVYTPDDGWWPLEGGNQSIAEMTTAAENFGLEVRVQARRRA